MTGQIVADLHLHSKYSRAVSKNMVPSTMARWGRKKGIDLLSTGDWFHSLWLRELEANLEEVNEGIYMAKGDPEGARYILSAEISSIYSQGGRGRRVHTLVFAPNLKVAGKINQKLLGKGCNLSSDGRPIVGLSCQELAEVVFEVDEKCLVIPAHVWTPWFAMYGSKSGFDSVGECFGKYADRIYAVETGLSSDPAMNWSIKELEKRAIVSFSDAHSPAKLGREATVFKLKTENKKGKTNLTYDDIYWAIAERFVGENKGRFKISYTLEFYPEEGKYHYTGHRKCKVVQSPSETRSKGAVCHVCGKPLTVGVMHRVEEVSQGRFKEYEVDKLEKRKNDNGVVGVYHPGDKTRPPYVMLVPLLEIISEVCGVGVNSKKVGGEYEKLLAAFGSELEVLLRVNLKDLSRIGGERLAEAIGKVRAQDISVSPGFDGEFGKVRIWSEGKTEEGGGQMDLF